MPRILITAGPTHEPIDAVRYIGNRSSGRLGIALAENAQHRGWNVTLLLGPVGRVDLDPGIQLERFTTCADLERLLQIHLADCDVLIMAAAVADFRPKLNVHAADIKHTKLKRAESGLYLDLEPTPDLLVGVRSRRQPNQTIVGFALEPNDRLESSARRKLADKGLDMIVANPLETMDAPTIEATIICSNGRVVSTSGKMSKVDFAKFLLDLIESERRSVSL